METIRCDVLVCGGGTAGLPAALAAARKGRQVCVVEDNPRIGGAMVDQFVQLRCGEPVQGIFRELLEGAAAFNPEQKNHNGYPYASCLMVWNALFEGLPVRFFCGEPVREVELEDGAVRAVRTEYHTFCAAVVIDTTGDGVVAAMAGCPFRYGREAKSAFGERFAPETADRAVQRCTMLYQVTRRSDCPHREPGNWVSIDDDTFLIWGPSLECKDTTDPVCVREVQWKALEMVRAESATWLEKGFYISGIAPKIGVRESRRLVGAFTLCYNDILEKRTYPDAVAVVNYPIDFWDPVGRSVDGYSGVEEENAKTPFYEIPYRCLYNPDISNLLFAGRCISATHIAAASLRVMAIASVTGQAAGLAAAQAAEGGLSVGAVDTDRLRRELRKGGVAVSLDEFLKTR